MKVERPVLRAKNWEMFCSCTNLVGQISKTGKRKEKKTDDEKAKYSLDCEKCTRKSTG